MANAVAIFTPGQRLVDTAGTPYANCTAEFYVGGTSYGEPKTVYSDADLLNALGTTVYFDSAGYPVTASGGSAKTLVYTNTGSYGIIIKDHDGVTVASHDNVKGAVVDGSSGASSSGITQSQADIRYIRNVNALSTIADIADADLIPLWDVSAAANVGMTYASLKSELTTDFRADGRMFPVGTAMIFSQTTPPTGWTKITASYAEDASLRMTTGTVYTGGTAPFSSVFASKTPTGTVGFDTPTIGKTASHNHTGGFTPVSHGAGGVDPLWGYNSLTGPSTGYEGGSNPHNHTFTGNALDFDVKYVMAVLAVKA